MFQQNNKRIVLLVAECLLVLIAVGLIFFKKQDFLNSYCITKMGNNLQYICRYNNSFTKNVKAASLLKIKSGDRLVLALNVKEILASKLGKHNILTGETINNVNLQDGQICVVVYPVLMHEYMFNDNQGDYDNFYKNYQWSLLPNNILNKQTLSVNSICTNRMNLAKLNSLILDLSIPKKQYLFLAKFDTLTYGIKLLFVPNNLLGNITTSQDVEKNYSQMIPFYLYNQNINVGL
ncbi:MAG TPA: hypothetical protein PK547_02055 [Candidatus Paceibacterota bacterium]|nr:hypothetical protein [Candidatus Paceibacterota bacterium]